MDAFEENNFGELEKDPVADFLQREQDQLAGLQDNFDSLSTEDASRPQEEFNASLGYGSVMPTSGGELWDSKFQADEDQFGLPKESEKVKQEPEKIKKWREEQTERLRIKDAESEKKNAEWREIAKRELEEWYKHRNELLDKTMKMNRESEDTFVQDRDEKKPGGEWERVCRMCDFNPKGSRNNKDVSRMRSILLQLKQAPVH